MHYICIRGDNMDKKHIIIIVLVIILVALIALIGVSLMGTNQNDVKVYNNVIDDVGSFNTTNETNFTVDSDSDDGGTHYLAEDPVLAEVTTFSQTSLMENTISQSEKVEDSPEGHTIYKTTANIGEHKGEVRYFSFLTDQDKGRHIYVGSEDYNLTCMMVDSFKIF